MRQQARVQAHRPPSVLQKVPEPGEGTPLPCSGREPGCRVRCVCLGLLGVILEDVTKALARLQFAFILEAVESL